MEDILSPKKKIFLQLIGTDKTSLSDNEMVVGDGVYNWLNSHYYNESYNFISALNGDSVNLNIVKVLNSGFNSADIIIVNRKIAKKILGNTTLKKVQYLDSTILNYRSGFYKVLYITVGIGFIILFYLRYSQLITSELMEKEILKSVGWSENLFLKFKMVESIIISFGTVTISTVLSYVYLFIFNAPLLNSIFFGVTNINSDIKITPFINFWLFFGIVIIYFIGVLTIIILTLKKTFNNSVTSQSTS